MFSLSRAQAGMEYLMTYGWALVLIVSVASVLFFVFSTPSSSQAVFSSSDLLKMPVKTGEIVNGTVNLKMQNLTGGNITVKSVSLGGSFGFSPVYLNGVLVTEINLGKQLVVNAGTDLSFSGISYSGSGVGTIGISYSDYAGTTRSVSVKGGNNVNLSETPTIAFGSESSPGLSCKDILSKQPASASGNYWINPSGSDNFQVYCDMVTDGGGWTRIDYTADLPHASHGSGGDKWLWIDSNFQTTLSKDRIIAIQSVSTQGKQRYVGSCTGVLHWYYTGGSTYEYAFGFMFLNGSKTGYGTSNPGINITTVQDDCKANDGVLHYTIWDISDVRVPIINVYSRDNGDSGEFFGSALTSNPAWFR